MLSTMNMTAAALPALPNNGAKVGLRNKARSLPRGSDSRLPSQTMARTMKKTPASKPLANIVRGTTLAGATVSPTWQAAASKAGAANPMSYRPAMRPVSWPNQPGNGVVS